MEVWGCGVPSGEVEGGCGRCGVLTSTFRFAVYCQRSSGFYMYIHSSKLGFTCKYRL